MAVAAEVLASTSPSGLTTIRVLRNVFSYNNLVHAVAGAVGSSFAISSFFPFDTARTRLQVDEKRKAKYSLQVIAEILEEEGFDGLYLGWFPVVSSICISNFVYFYTYNSLKAMAYKGGGQPYALKDLSLACIAGVVNVLTTTPFWVANTRLKLQGAKLKSKDLSDSEEHYSGLWDCLQKIFHREGLKALWNGTSASLMLVSNPSIQWMVYESLKRYVQRALKKTDLTAFTYFILGAFAKMIATMFTYPLQIVQARDRAARKTGNSTRKGTFETLQTIARNQGIQGLYKGLETKLTQTVLMAAVMYLTYEKVAAFVFALMGQSYPVKKTL